MYETRKKEFFDMVCNYKPICYEDAIELLESDKVIGICKEDDCVFIKLWQKENKLSNG